MELNCFFGGGRGGGRRVEISMSVTVRRARRVELEVGYTGLKLGRVPG